MEEGAKRQQRPQHDDCKVCLPFSCFSSFSPFLCMICENGIFQVVENLFAASKNFLRSSSIVTEFQVPGFCQHWAQWLDSWMTNNSQAGVVLCVFSMHACHHISFFSAQFLSVPSVRSSCSPLISQFLVYVSSRKSLVPSPFIYLLLASILRSCRCPIDSPLSHQPPSDSRMEVDDNKLQNEEHLPQQRVSELQSQYQSHFCFSELPRCACFHQLLLCESLFQVFDHSLMSSAFPATAACSAVSSSSTAPQKLSLQV